MKPITQKRKKQVLDSEVPSVELFGVDGRGRGRPNGEMVINAPSPQFLDPEVARKISGQAHIRASAVIRLLYKDEFERVYAKEVAHLSRKHILSLSSEKEKSNGRTEEVAN